MELDESILSDSADLAMMYNDEDTTWEKDTWRYNRADAIGKGELVRLRHRNLVKKDESAWSSSNITWKWTPRYEVIHNIVKDTEITELSETKLEVMKEHSDEISRFPLYDSFLSCEYELIGKIAVFTTNGILVKEDNRGSKASRWKLAEDVQRVLVQILSKISTEA